MQWYPNLINPCFIHNRTQKINGIKKNKKLFKLRHKLARFEFDGSNSKKLERQQQKPGNVSDSKKEQLDENWMATSLGLKRTITIWFDISAQFKNLHPCVNALAWLACYRISAEQPHARGDLR